MDYSLLIGIHDSTKATLPGIEDEAQNEDNPGSPRQRATSSSNENEVGYSERPDSDQDNFSPAEDAYDTDDGQLNGKYHLKTKIFFFFFK